MNIECEVTAVEKNSKLSWMGKIVPGLKGEHFFIIEQDKNKGVRFIQKEIYSGFLVLLLKKKLDTKTRQSFVDINTTLKKLSES